MLRHVTLTVLAATFAISVGAVTAPVAGAHGTSMDHGAAGSTSGRSSGSSADLPAPMPSPVNLGGWRYRMAARQQMLFASAIATSPGRLRNVVREVAPLTTVSVSPRTRCGGTASCAVGTVTTTDLGTSVAYEIEFNTRQFDRTRKSRFLMLHEVAHVVDFDRISDAEMAIFERHFRASRAWRSCFPHAGTCVSMDEIFAEQFAMYGTGAASSMTTYGIPRLIAPAVFERLLVDAAKDQEIGPLAPE